MRTILAIFLLATVQLCFTFDLAAYKQQYQTQVEVPYKNAVTVAATDIIEYLAVSPVPTTAAGGRQVVTTLNAKAQILSADLNSAAKSSDALRQQLDKQVEQLVALAKEKDVFFMEGLWIRFFPSYQHARKQIRNGQLGEILAVKAEFGLKDLVKVDRLSKKAMGGGTILDMGVYTIQACQWVLEEEPKSIKAKGTLNEEGVDIEMSAELDYGDNKRVQINISALNQYSNSVVIVGTKGQITINEIFCSTRIIDLDGKEKHWPLPTAKFDFHYPNSCGLRYEADEVRKAIRAGKKRTRKRTTQRQFGNCTYSR